MKMYEFIEATIQDNIRRPDAFFVFPSEVAAASWARRTLETSGERALSTDRFLGWDTFKERLFALRREERPADRRTRILWAWSALADNSREPFLRVLIHPEHREEYQGHIPYVAGILPRLKRIHERANRAPGDAKIRDLSALYAKYSAFLRDRGLFEPSYEPLPAPEVRGYWFLFCPGLAQDYEEYRTGLSALPSIRILDAPPLGEAPTLLEFPNLYEELRWIFLSVARDLDAGLRPEETAVTVTDLELSAPWIRKAAALAGVPVELRSGPPLASHPVGRFLGALGACSERGFDLESMTSLLLDRFLPWKEPETVRALIRFGIQRHAYAPFHAEGRRRDPWLESFRVCRSDHPGLESFYRKFRAGAEELTGAKDFRSLSAAFVKFRGGFLDETRFSDEDERSFQRAMVEAEGFAREADALDLTAPGGSVFPLFRSALSEIRYVPQSAGPAVPVYAYRVSALLAATRHYVAGGSQEGLRVAFGDAPGLRDDQKETLGFPDRDASPAYAAAYAASGGTVFTYAVDGLGGWNLPYPWFSRFGRVAPPEDYEEVRNSDPWRGEARAWAGGPFPENLLAEQIRAVEDGVRGLRSPASNYETDLADPKAARTALTRSLTDDGRLRISATHVEEMRICPFAWLLSRGLALEEEKTGVGFFDAILAGQMAHETLRHLYERISDSGPFDARRLPEYRSWVGPAIARTLPDFEKKHGPFLRPMFESYVPKLTDRIYRLLEDEAKCFEGWEVRDLEGELAKDYPEISALLVGRLDRLARRNDQYAIIDYKKRSIPRARDVFPDAEGNLGALQMAAYILVCEAGEKPIVRARYWSIEDAVALDVLGPDAAARKDYDEALALFEGYMRDTAERLRNGDFRPPRPENRDCAGCGWQAVCRVRYATE